MSLDLLLNGPVGTTVGWTLIHLLWQATAVALILGAVRTLWSRASSNARYLTSIFALVAVLILPALTFSHLWEGVESPSALLFSTTESSVAELEHEATASHMSAGTSSIQGVESWISKSLPWLVAIWMAGVLLLGLRLLVRTAWTARLTRERLTDVEGSWQRALARLCRKLEIRKVIGLYESALVEVPTVVGWLRPVILVPTSVFTGLTYRQIETILAHELAHIRRHDAFVNYLQSVVETLFFFHPAIWWISGRIRIEREHCCDDVALAVCRDRVAYAKALTFLEEMRATPPANALAATGGSLLERIRRIAGVEERDRKAPSIAALILLLTLGGATAWGVSAPQDDAEADVEVEVSGSGWWYVDPPPEPPAPPHPPVPFPASMVPAPPEPPDPPAAPEPPSPSGDWMIDSMDISDWTYDLPDAPAPPSAPAPPRMTIAGMSMAPRSPEAPPAPRVRSSAPRAEESYRVRGRRVEDSNRKISDKLSIDDLIALRSVGVTPEYLRDLRSAGYDDLTIGEVVGMRGVGVSPEYIAAMRKAFGRELTADDLMHLRGVGVNPEWLASMQKHSGRRLSVEDATHLRGVGVSPEWLASMSRTLGEDLSIEDAIRLRGVGVSESYIRELAERGIAIPATEDLIRLRGVGVTPEYIDEMKQAGLATSIEELVRMRGVGVSPAYVAALKRARLGDLDTDTIVSLRGVGVTPEYVEMMRKAGYTQLEPARLIQLRGVGVTPEYVQGMRDAGYPVSSVEELVSLRGVGVTPAYVKEMRDAGVEDLTVEKLIRLRASGIDADYIRDMRN